MSFSFAAPPPPQPSPPLRSVALAPAPSPLTLAERRAARTRQRATLPSPLPTHLATPSSLLFSSTSGSLVDPGRTPQSASHFAPPRSPSTKSRSSGGSSIHEDDEEEDRRSLSSSTSKTSRPTTIVPILRNPLPPHCRYPSPAPSLASSVSTVASSSASVSSAFSPTLPTVPSIPPWAQHRRRTITAIDAIASPPLSEYVASPRPMRPITAPTVLKASADEPKLLLSPNPASALNTATITRSRGRSISRSLRRAASVFGLINSASNPDIPPVPPLRRA